MSLEQQIQELADMRAAIAKTVAERTRLRLTETGQEIERVESELSSLNATEREIARNLRHLAPTLDETHDAITYKNFVVAEYISSIVHSFCFDEARFLLKVDFKEFERVVKAMGEIKNSVGSQIAYAKTERRAQIASDLSRWETKDDAAE